MQYLELLHEYFIGHVEPRRTSHGFFTLYPTGSKLQNDVDIFLIYARGLLIPSPCHHCWSCECLQQHNFYVSIHLVRVDQRSGNLIILAGESIEVEILPNGTRIIR